MTFKVYYQPDATKRPVRENTQSLYIEADSEAQALLLVEENTDYNIEFVEQLDDKAEGWCNLRSNPRRCFFDRTY